MKEENLKNMCLYLLLVKKKEKKEHLQCTNLHSIGFTLLLLFFIFLYYYYSKIHTPLQGTGYLETRDYKMQKSANASGKNPNQTPCHTYSRSIFPVKACFLKGLNSN